MSENVTIYLFTGPNTYALREEKRRWKQQFVDKHGEENLLVLSNADLTFRTLADEVGSAPFIGEKRLVCIEGMPKFTKEEIEMLPSVIHPSTVLLVSDAAPDKRLASTKALLKLATVKEFTPMPPAALRAWMQQFLRERQTSIDRTGEELLLSLVGSEQEVLASEMEKLAASPKHASLTAEDIRTLVVPWGDQEIWHLTNLLAGGKRDEALQYADSMLRQGEDPHSLWSMLLWMLRNLVIVAAAASEGVTQPATLTSRFGVPFPTVRTLAPIARRATVEQRRSLVRWATDSDIALKTGGYKSTTESTEELRALIEQLIAAMAATTSADTPARV